MIRLTKGCEWVVIGLLKKGYEWVLIRLTKGCEWVVLVLLCNVLGLASDLIVRQGAVSGL